MAVTAEVLALPGLLCDAYVWEHQAHDLSDIARFHVPDLTRCDRLEAMAEAALALVDGPVMVAGHSMGGRVAFEIWRMAPSRVRGLALLDTGVHPVRPGETEKRRELIKLAYEKGMAVLAEAWLPPMVHPGRVGDASLMRPLREMVLRRSPDQFARQQSALLHRRDAAPILETVGVPTLVGVGRQDGWSPLADHEEIAARIPGAELMVFEDTGHMATVENPAAVTAALRKWLEG